MGHLCADRHGDLLPFAAMMGFAGSRSACAATVRRDEQLYRCHPRFRLDILIKQPRYKNIKQNIFRSPSVHIFFHRTASSTLNPITRYPTQITMSAATQQRQQVYISEGFSEPMNAQHNFANTFDLDNPEAAMSEYQRYVVA